MNFRPRIVIKGQAQEDFIAEFTYADAVEVAGTVDKAEAAKVAKAQGEKNSTFMKEDTAQWTIYMDDTSNDTGDISHRLYRGYLMIQECERRCIGKTGFDKGHGIARCSVHGVPGRAQYQAVIKNNGAGTRTIMDGPYHCLSEEWLFA